MAKRCECSAGPMLIFSCSGAADVGEVSDLAARQLAKNGVGKMFCLAGLGGRVSGIVASTKAAKRILAIDGCALDCARQTLELAEIQGFAHVRITDLGFEKGTTQVTKETVAKVSQEARSLLRHDEKGDNQA